MKGILKYSLVFYSFDKTVLTLFALDKIETTIKYKPSDAHEDW